MLNYNKIESSFNSGHFKKNELFEHIGIKPGTFYDKIKRKSFTPNELEKIADFFNKPISYYFDKGNDTQYQVIDDNTINEPCPKKVCKECTSKQNEIDALKQALEAKEELLQMYRDKKENCSKNSA